jgi:hypothetical protein
MTQSYDVDLIFQEVESGASPYTFTYVYHVDDPKETIKYVRHEGTRGDGCIFIPGGKKSQEIEVKGRLRADGYENLTTLMNTLKSSITTELATLTLKHRLGVGAWTTDWEYTIRRISEIKFSQSYRTDEQEYEITFLVISY